MQTVDNITPGDRWQFDADVTSVFDDMLQRSIPQYDVMRSAVTNLAKQYIQPQTAVIDLGSSRGEAVAKLIDCYALKNRFLLVEVSQSMIEVLQERFAHYINVNTVAIRDIDLRVDFPQTRASVVLSVLTLQFVPIEYRQRIIHQTFDALEPGGAFIVVEKVLGATADIDRAMVQEYYALKDANGYTPEQVERKKLSLEGVLVPVTSAMNVDMLKGAGFAQVDCFWRWMNFAGWIAIKGW